MKGFNLKRLVAKIMREAADKIDSDTCEMTDEEAMDLMSVLSHQAMSKEDACIYLNLSRSQFDNLIRDNKISKGKKRKGFKELVFYRDELDAFKWRRELAKRRKL